MTPPTSTLTALARRLLAAPFLYGGQDALRHPGPLADAAAPALARLAGPLHLPKDPELLVRANGALWLGAGGLLAASRLPRTAATVLAATVLAASLLPGTFLIYPFWREHDPARRWQQREQLLKNLGLVGGMLLAARTSGRIERTRRRTGPAGADPKP